MIEKIIQYSILTLIASITLTMTAFSSEIGTSIDQFKTPPQELKTAPLWFWNTALTNITTTDLQQFVLDSKNKSGYQGFGILPFFTRQSTPTSTDGYLSDDYFAKYGSVVTKANELGMNLSIYDEYGFPSGPAGGLLVAKYPEAIVERLDMISEDVVGPKAAYYKVIPSTANILGAVAMNKDTLDRVDISEFLTKTGVTYSASSTYTISAGYTADMAFDGNAGTRWNADSMSGGNQWLAASSNDNVQINRVVLKEALNRITSFKLQYYNGTSWVDITTGTTIGASKEITFSTITTKSIRLYINSVTTDSASIYEFEIYNGTTKLFAKTNNLTYDVPAGNWKIMIFYCVKGDFKGVDYLNQDSVDKFIDITYKPYYDRFSQYFGNTINSVFYDEPTFYPWSYPNYGALGARLWTSNFNDKVKEKYGINPITYYPALWYDIGNDTNYARNILFGMRAELFATSYIKRINDWCNAHGVKLKGHMLFEEYQNPVGNSGDLLKVFKYQDIPGNDQISQYNGHSKAFKITSSAMFNYDKSQCMTETFGIEDFGPNILYQETMNQYAKGINEIIPHAVWYDTNNITYNPDLSYRNSKYADELPKYNNYVARLNLLLRGGRHVADIGVLYPIAGLQSAYKFSINEDANPSQCVPAEADYLDVGESLFYNAKLDYTYIHPEVLNENCEVNGATIKLNNTVNFENYKVFIIPGTATISVDNLRKIKVFYQNGGKVISTTKLPLYASEGASYDAEVRQLINEIFGVDPTNVQVTGDFSTKQNENGGVSYFIKDYAKSLVSVVNNALSKYDVQIEKNNTINQNFFGYIHKVNNYMGKDRNIYFFANSGGKMVNTKVTVRDTITPFAFNPHNGTISPINYTANADGSTSFNLSLDSINSQFIIDIPEGVAAISQESMKYVLTLDATNTIGISAKINGQTYALPAMVAFNYGENVSVEMIPSAKYFFKSWGGDITEQNQIMNLTMNKSYYIKANITNGDVALSANGAIATASSSYYTGKYTVDGVTDGDRTEINWGNNGGWNSANSKTNPQLSASPEWIEIDFSKTRTISGLALYTTTSGGINSFKFQYYNGTTFVDVPNASVTDGTNSVFNFSINPITTSKIKVLITGTKGGVTGNDFCRVIEIEAWMQFITVNKDNSGGVYAKFEGDNGSGCLILTRYNDKNVIQDVKIANLNDSIFTTPAISNYNTTDIFKALLWNNISNITPTYYPVIYTTSH